MKVGVSSSGNSLEAPVDPRFGRCPYFVVVDLESKRFEAVPNSAAASGSGAGIQAAQMVASNQVQVVITGSVGPNAFRALSAAGATVFTGALGKVGEVVEKFKNGLLSEYKGPTVKGHSGMGARRGLGGVRGEH